MRYAVNSVPIVQACPSLAMDRENPSSDTQKLNYSFQNIPNSQYL